jgi:hypothetical protein
VVLVGTPSIRRAIAWGIVPSRSPGAYRTGVAATLAITNPTPSVARPWNMRSDRRAVSWIT